MRFILNLAFIALLALILIALGDEELFGPAATAFFAGFGYEFPAYEFPDVFVSLHALAGVKILALILALTIRILLWMVLKIIGWLFWPIVIGVVIFAIIFVRVRVDVAEGTWTESFLTKFAHATEGWNWFGIIAGIIGLIVFRWIWTREVDESI